MANGLESNGSIDTSRPYLERSRMSISSEMNEQDLDKGAKNEGGKLVNSAEMGLAPEDKDFMPDLTEKELRDPSVEDFAIPMKKDEASDATRDRNPPPTPASSAFKPSTLGSAIAGHEVSHVTQGHGSNY